MNYPVQQSDLQRGIAKNQPSSGEDLAKSCLQSMKSRWHMADYTNHLTASKWNRWWFSGLHFSVWVTSVPLHFSNPESRIQDRGTHWVWPCTISFILSPLPMINWMLISPFSVMATILQVASTSVVYPCSIRDCVHSVIGPPKDCDYCSAWYCIVKESANRSKIPKRWKYSHFIVW